MPGSPRHPRVAPPREPETPRSALERRGEAGWAARPPHLHREAAVGPSPALCREVTGAQEPLHGPLPPDPGFRLTRRRKPSGQVNWSYQMALYMIRTQPRSAMAKAIIRAVGSCRAGEGQGSSGGKGVAGAGSPGGAAHTAEAHWPLCGQRFHLRGKEGQFFTGKTEGFGNCTVTMIKDLIGKVKS